jgi:hypothetical protein
MQLSKKQIFNLSRRHGMACMDVVVNHISDTLFGTRLNFLLNVSSGNCDLF